MYCIHCGKELPNNAKFCAYCGQPLLREDFSDSYSPGNDDTVTEITEQEYSQDSGEMGHKPRLVIWIIVAVIVIVVVALLIYFNFSNRTPNTVDAVADEEVIATDIASDVSDYESVVLDDASMDVTDSEEGTEDDSDLQNFSDDSTAKSVLDNYLIAKYDFDFAAMANYWPDYQYDSIMALMGYDSREKVIDACQGLYNQIKEELDQTYGDWIVDTEIVEIKNVDINEVNALLQGNSYVELPEIQKAKRAEVKNTLKSATNSDEVYTITTSFIFLVKINSTWYVAYDQELN